MTTTKNTTTSVAQAKAIALLQHLQIDYFILDGQIYRGDIDEIEESYREEKQSNQSEDYSFEDYCSDNCDVIDEDDFNTTNDISFEGAEYLVLTNDEADDRWEESLDNYIDECILPLIPSEFHNYFDRDSWIEDAKYDGRGHSLSFYDGEEYEEIVDSISYYIYRTN